MSATAGRAQWTSQHRDTTRTLQALLAAALGILPLCQIFSDTGWLIDAWLTMIIVIGPAAVLRMNARPGVMQVVLGLVLALFWLTARFASAHAVLGFIPGPGAWHDVSRQLTQVHDTITNGVAPVHTTPAVRLVLCALLALFAALVDLIGVIARRGALAGVPLLIVYTVSGAVPRQTVQWLLFTGAAAGFLLLLSLDANDDIASWGRLMPRPGAPRATVALAVSGQRIAVIAIAAAVVLPVIAPAKPTNVIANAFHNGGSGSLGSLGEGISLDPLAALKGDLTRPKTANLYTVTLASAPIQAPFYARVNVLDTFTNNKGWTASGTEDGGTSSVDSGQFPVLPADGTGAGADNAVDYTATFKIAALGGNPPAFAQPTAVSGLPGSTVWNPTEQLLQGSKVHRGDQYTEVVTQPNPSAGELAASPDLLGDPALASWFQVPTGMPQMVIDLVNRLTNAQQSPYDKALAIYGYFTNPANGFFYSLNATAGNSGNDLVDFLTNKGGFCQQFAAAMGIMLRMAGVPARVVLGYTHPVTPGSTSFTVTTADAHAWDEAYFGGVGWVPFDATPLSGIDGGARADLPWAPHPTGANASVGAPRDTSTNTRKATGTATSTGSAQATATGSQAKAATDLWPLLWVGLGVLALVIVVLVPAWVRWRRRRHRLHAARLGDPDPLWTELSATAVDLGYVWSPARSPRQVVGWLDRSGLARSASLTALAAAVEAARYAPGSSATAGSPGSADAAGASGASGAAAATGVIDPAGLVDDLQAVEAQLRSGRSLRVRLRSRLLPASLGWTPGQRRRRRS